MKAHKNTARWNDTGGTFETGCLYPMNDPRVRTLESIDAGKIQYRNLAAAVLECIDQNPAQYTGSELWDPPTGWMRDIHYAITERLGLKDWKRLTIVPALKTAADRYHGIDFIVVYNEPETEREVIVTVDLSLRKKESFKADILVTDTGAEPHPDYYNTRGCNVDDIPDATAREDEITRELRRQSIGHTIGDIIDEKLRGEDPHYAPLMRSIGKRIHDSVEQLLER